MKPAVRQYSENYPLKYGIIVHEKKMRWFKPVVLTISTTSFIGLLTLFYIHLNKYIVLEGVLMSIVIIAVFIYYFYLFKKNFRITGFLILSGDKLFVENDEVKTTFDKGDLKNFKIELNFFEYIPYLFLIPILSSRIRRGGRFDGSKNLIEFEYDNKSYSFEILIDNRGQLDLLSKRAEEWNIKTNL